MDTSGACARRYTYGAFVSPTNGPSRHSHWLADDFEQLKHAVSDIFRAANDVMGRRWVSCPWSQPSPLAHGASDAEGRQPTPARPRQKLGGLITTLVSDALLELLSNVT
jgi:hypothetical protein